MNIDNFSFTCRICCSSAWIQEKYILKYIELKLLTKDSLFYGNY